MDSPISAVRARRHREFHGRGGAFVLRRRPLKIPVEPAHQRTNYLAQLRRVELVEFIVSITEQIVAPGRQLAQSGLVFAGPESDFSYGQIISFDGGWTAGGHNVSVAVTPATP
jgi:hypothetical protein